MSKQPLCVIVTPDPMSNGGGVERFSHLISELVVQNGWRSKLVGPGDRTTSRLVSRLGLEYLLRSIDCGRQARRAKPDLVISNGFLGLGSSSACARIHVFHGTMVDHVCKGGVEGRLRYRLRLMIGGALAESLCARRAAKKVAVSESAASELRRYYRINVDAVIPNGVDTEIFQPRDKADSRARLGLPLDARLALFVGRPEHRKGFDLVPTACKAAGFDLLVAGPSAPADSVHLGVLAPEELAVAYSAADCVVFPTRYEACSYVVLEAIACGVPLITTSVGWLPTLLKHVPSYRKFVVEPTVESVVNALERLESDPAWRDSVALAHQFVEKNNSLRSFAAEWLLVINETMEAKWPE